MEDSLVALMNNTLVTSQARRRTEGASTNATRELWSWQHAHGERQKLDVKLESPSNVLN